MQMTIRSPALSTLIKPNARFFALVASMMWVFFMPAHAEIYKWRDGKGVMNYSDMPPPNQIQPIEKIKTQKLNLETPLTRADAYAPSDVAPAKARPDENATTPERANQVQSEQMAVVKAMEDRLKAKNCLAARSNYRNYAVGGRMQNVNEGGEKEFLSEAQIQEGLNQAQREIDENCPPE